MQQLLERNGHQWGRFFMLWLSVFLWGAFLVYMLLFHYQRELFEPIVMGHFNITSEANYQFSEIRLFLYLFFSCCIVSILAIFNTFGKRRRKNDNTPDKFLFFIMITTVVFAFYYAKTDLSYLNGTLSFLATMFGD